MTDTRTGHGQPNTRSDQSLVAWLVLLLPLVVLAAIVAGGVLSDQPQTAATGSAPDFVLSSTTGETLSLTDVLEQGDAMLYFSMGVGCDGCFMQIPEIASVLHHLDIRLVPIMVDPPELLAREAARLGVDDPIYVDPGGRVAGAYGMLGQFGHGDTPSHSFALVNQNRAITWVRHYPEMFVPAERFLADLPEEIP